MTSQFSNLRVLVLALGVALLGLASPSSGATIVVPNSLATVEGNTNNGFPFNIALFGLDSQRYQQAFDASDFGALSTPELITQIAFRPDRVDGSPFASTLTNIQINLSTTSAAPDGLSSIFADNVGGDDTVVYSGSLSLTTADTGPPAGPKDFDIVINLQTPFLYDPNLGNLLMDVRNNAGGSTTQFDSHIADSDSVSRLYSVTSNGVNDTSGILDSLGLIARFATIPADSDGDGVPDDLDVCPDTVIPEGVPTQELKPNRWSLVDDDGVFDTTLPPGGGTGPNLSFAISDTGGCSCEQIIDALDLGKGHEHYGCSISAMETWVALVNP